jgi:hypothetical protein
MKIDCGPDRQPNMSQGIPAAITSHLSDVVRIVSLSNGEPIVRTGLISSDETVITVGNYQRGSLTVLPPDTEVQIVSCGKVEQTFKVASSVPLSQGSASSPYLKVTVPGLKLQGEAPRFEYDTFGSLFVVGYLRRSDGLFYQIRERPPPGIDNDNRRIFAGEKLSRWSDVGDDDETDRFDLDVPFGPGLLGSPVFSSEGKVVGLLDIGQFAGGNLVLGVGISSKPLAGLPRADNAVR